jgi:WD40 repeat protein
VTSVRARHSSLGHASGRRGREFKSPPPDQVRGGFRRWGCNDLRIAFITVADQLFVGSLGGELVQYDLDTLAPIRSFGGSGGAIQELDGTSDGSTIAARGGDGNVSLFDVATGNRVSARTSRRRPTISC